jgi:integrase
MGTEAARMASIRKLDSGRWNVQVYLGRHPETRKHRFESKTFALRKEAEDWARGLETQRDQGVYRPSVTKLTFADYLRDKWLPLYSTQVRSTYTIEKVLGKWIMSPQPETPFLGRIQLRKLTVSDFDRLYAAMADERKHGMQRRGIEHLHGILKRALKSAVRKGELPRNPADFATLPKPNVRATITTEADEDEMGPVGYLSREQAMRFLAVAKQDRLSALWHLLLDGGLRPGEAFALQWRHVDFERGIVKVRGTLSRVRGELRRAEGQGWAITKPKTESSRGDVPLSLMTMNELRKWKAQQNKERLQVGAEWQDHGFVFTTELGSPLGNNTGRRWNRLIAAADKDGDLGTWGPVPKKPRSGPMPEREFTPKYSLYVLRHSCATLALLDGVDLLQVSRRLRHKNLGITARFYGHMKAEHTTQAAESFNRLAISVSSARA